MMQDKPTIGITGASGLLGRFCAKHFNEQGYPVIGMFRDQHPDIAIQWEQGNILDISVVEKFVEKCDIVVHTAAQLRQGNQHISHLYQVNVEGTENIVHALLEYPTKKLIHISSISALGRAENELLNEKNHWNSELYYTDYGKSKMLAEMVVNKGIAEGLDAMILSPSMILAKVETNRSSSSIWSQIEKIPTIAPKGQTGFVDARDVAISVEKAIQHWEKGNKIIISGHNISYRDFYGMVSGKDVNSIKLSNPVVLKLLLPFVKLMYKLSGKTTDISQTTINTSAKNFSYDNSKSIRELDMHYRPLEETVAFFTKKN